jgi:hypothetical protein
MMLGSQSLDLLYQRSRLPQQGSQLSAFFDSFARIAPMLERMLITGRAPEASGMLFMKHPMPFGSAHS